MASIAPEFWKNISFGQEIDFYGGKSVPLESGAAKILFDAETSRGHIQLRLVDEHFNLLAVDLGIGLLYNRGGILETVGVDIPQYCKNMDEEDIAGLDGALVEMLKKMAGNGEHLFLTVELKEKFVAIANLNEKTEENEVLYSAENVEFAQSNAVTVNYKGYTMFLGIDLIEDELHFGINAGFGESAVFDSDKDLFLMKILTDCNYQTYLDSRLEDRFEKLAARVFIID